MIVYNNNWLYKLYVREQADEALHEGAISDEAHRRIYEWSSVGFYTPNIYARVGLAIATFLAVLVGWSFFAYFFSLTTNYSKVFGTLAPLLLIVTSVICYVIAVSYIKNNNFYNAGTDNMLIWLAAVLMPTGIYWLAEAHITTLVLCLMLLATTVFTAIRFADRLMSVFAFLSLLACIYFICTKGGEVGQGIVSFAIMGVSGIVYYLLTPVERLKPLFRNCIYYVRLVALLTLYAAGNYYMVCSAATGFSRYTQGSITGGLSIFFWACTFGIPLVYLAIGIRKRELMLMRTGALLLVAGVLTFRQYHSVLPAEIALSMGGIVAIAVAYWLLVTLREGKAGFTAQKGFAGHEKRAIELLLEDRLLKNKNENRHEIR